MPILRKLRQYLDENHVAYRVRSNAGNHEQTVHLAYADFARLVAPKVASFRMA